MCQTLKLTCKDQQTLIDLNKKLQLEKAFIPIIQKQFRQERKALNEHFVEFEDIPPLSPVIWQELIQTQYNRSFNVFTDFTEMNDFERGMLFNSFDRFSDSRSAFDSAIIVDTTQRQMVSSLNEAETALRDEGLDISKIAIAATANRILSRKQAPRVTSIAATETQAPSEEAKSSEAEAKKQENKTWHTILDGLERQAHLNADGQKVAINVPFQVKGELLKQPGDTSLGATMGNIINCRCGATYV